MNQPLLRPSPGRQEESDGQVVAHRWFRLGLTCHHPRLRFASTVQCVWARAVWHTQTEPTRTNNRRERLMSQFSPSTRSPARVTTCYVERYGRWTTLASTPGMGKNKRALDYPAPAPRITRLRASC